MAEKIRGPRNRTVTLTEQEVKQFATGLLKLKQPAALADILNRTICQDVFETLSLLPDKFIDLLIIDPPYNLTRSFNGRVFKKLEISQYGQWLDKLVQQFVRLLKPDASIYVCGDWRSSTAIQTVLERYFVVRNRITWEREKGRGAAANWKNCAEDIWFCTVSDNYFFNLEAVKLKRKVIAPYKVNGQPKDWSQSEAGAFRLTHPSNIWTDLSIPFWSMPENTDHPTQKPEKLLAKLILASSQPGGLVFDPFLGSGTSSVVAKKLGRSYTGIEIDEYFSCLAEKRLFLAETNAAIQGYSQGIFWERNSLLQQLLPESTDKK